MKTILVIGTYDTKSDELNFLCDAIRGQGGQVLTMDVSVLGHPVAPTDISKHDVAAAAGSSIETAIAANDENTAMQIMGQGAATLARGLQAAGRCDGVIALGGTMGTDLALDVCAALPLGVPKYVVSTVAFSPMIPSGRLAPDIQMILWAGGLFGLNSLCKASLSQAAGAVLGAARAVEKPQFGRPIIGMTSFGKTVLRYMTTLKPGLEARGYEVAVFHATGMGGRAFESLAGAGTFAAVLDFAPQEVGNHHFGSAISAGADRLTNAGRRGTPQIVSVGCCDLVDVVGWHALPDRFRDRPIHAHNRLLASVSLDAREREDLAHLLCGKLAAAVGPVTLILPTLGGHEWDRPGGPLADPSGHARFCAALRSGCPDNVRLIDLAAHINDPAFHDAALGQIDDWIAAGVLPAVNTP